MASHTELHGNPSSFLEPLEPRLLLSNLVFGDGTDFAVGQEPSAVRLADVNGDGAMDIIAANTLDSTVSVLLGVGDGTFQDKVDYHVGSAPCSVDVADFDRDGRLDIVTANNMGGSISVLLGNGDGTFGTSQQTGLVGAVGWVEVVRAADLNGDDIQDVLVATSSETDDGSIVVMLGEGDGTFPTAVAYPVGQFPFAIAVGDFNGNGSQDVAIANVYSGTISVLLGNPNGTLQTHVDYAVGTDPFNIDTGDLNHDGNLDLSVGSLDGGTPYVLLGNGNGTFQEPLHSAQGGNGDIRLADINLDGMLDAVTGSVGADTVSVMTGNGDGTFQTGPTLQAGVGPLALDVGDLNNDGWPDIVAANFGRNEVAGHTVSVFLSSGLSNSAPTLTTMGTLAGAWEDSTFTITYNMLADAGDEADSDGDTISFMVDTVSGGALTKNGEAVVAGSTLVGPGESLVWSPEANANGTLDAFTVKAWDGHAASSTAVQVKVQVAAVNDAPTANDQSSFTNEDTELNGTVTGSDVEGSPLTYALVGDASHGNVTVQADGLFSYTPSADYNGPDSFTFTANDGELDSTPATVSITVNAVNDAPTLSSIGNLAGATEDTDVTISYATLAAAANEADVEGDTLSFRIESVTTGTLTKGGVPVTAGSTLLSEGESLVWHPAANANGTLNAFTVKAWDGHAASSTAVQVKVDTAAVNDAPTLSSVSNLTGAVQDTDFTISYAALAGAANENDVDGDALSFRIEAVTAGTLTKGGVPVTAGSTLLSAGESLVWHPTAGASGMLDAFTVKAWDGALASDDPAVQVLVQVAPQKYEPTDLTLTVADSSVWQSATTGSSVAWTATVKNNGPNWQRADWTVEWYLSGDKKFQATDTLIGSRTYSDDIAPGASVAKTMNAAVPNVPSGQKYLIARVVNAGLESKPANNVKANTDADWFGTITSIPVGHTIETATDLGRVAGSTTRLNQNLSTTGQDAYYKFTMSKPTAKSNYVRIDFANTEGDLTLQLLDAGGNVINTSDTSKKSEKISLNGLLAGDYYLRVFGKNGDVSRGYNLELVL